MKPRRHTDPELLAAIRKVPCAACLRPPPSDAHHIRTKMSGGPDEPWNILPLCRFHHNLWHQMGRARLFEKLPDLLGVLVYMGWVWDGKKLRHPRMQGGG